MRWPAVKAGAQSVGGTRRGKSSEGSKDASQLGPGLSRAPSLPDRALLEAPKGLGGGPPREDAERGQFGAAGFKEIPNKQ